jgi:basic membrane protein A
MLKRVDVGCASFVSDVLANKFMAGNHVFGLSNGGVGYALTGGNIDDIKSKIDAYGAKIKSGAIVVPEKPEGA